MTHAVAFVSKYQQTLNIGGNTVRSSVAAFCVMTTQGTAHFKIVKFAKSHKIFIDFDEFTSIEPGYDAQSFLTRNRLTLEKAPLFKRMRAAAAKHSTSPLTTTFCPITSLDSFAKEYPTEHTMIMEHMSAPEYWRRLTPNKEPVLEEIMSVAETIEAQRKQTFIEARTAAMASIDDAWGIF